MSERVKDKVAIVMGAGSVGPGWGNGKAAAVLYAREGARVLAVDLVQSAGEETQRIIQSEGGRCRALQADVSCADSVNAVVDECLRDFGRVDILHNNVGIPTPGGAEDTTEDDWDRLFAVNVRGMYLTCRACLPHMVRQGSGAIVNVSAIASIRQVGYSCMAYGARICCSTTQSSTLCDRSCPCCIRRTRRGSSTKAGGCNPWSRPTRRICTRRSALFWRG